MIEFLAVWAVVALVWGVSVYAVLRVMLITDPSLFEPKDAADQAALGFMLLLVLLGAPLFVLLRYVGKGAQVVTRGTRGKS